RGLRRYGQPAKDVLAEVLVPLGDQLERLLVQAQGRLLRPPPAGLVSRRHQVRESSLGLPSLAPVEAQGCHRVSEIRSGLLQEPGDRRMPLSSFRPRKGLVGDVADQDMLEGELLLAPDS